MMYVQYIEKNCETLVSCAGACVLMRGHRGNGTLAGDYKGACALSV